MNLHSLLPYYEAELSALREQGRLFSEKFPSVAAGLGLSATHCDDPHIERLLEGVAYLGARVQHRIDNTLPKLAQAMLALRYPDWLGSVPSGAVLQVQASNENTSEGKFTIPQGAEFRRSTPHHGDLILRSAWPIEITTTQFLSCELIQLQRSHDWQRRCPNANYALLLTIKPHYNTEQHLDVLIAGDNTYAWLWWHWLCHQSKSIWCQNNQRWLDTKKGVGLAGLSQESPMPLWPRDYRTPDIHALLVDYFALPEAYRFIRIPLPVHTEKILQLCIPLSLNIDNDLIENAQSGLSTNTFKPNCVAASNWTVAAAEPIRLNYQQADYSLRPNQKNLRNLVIQKVQDVHCTSLNADRQVPIHQSIEPFLSVQTISPTSSDAMVSRWHAYEQGNISMDQNAWRIAIVNNRFEPSAYGMESISANLMCTQGVTLRNAQVQDGITCGVWQLRQAGMKAKATLESRVSKFAAAKDTDESVWQLLATSSFQLSELIQGNAAALKQLLSALNRNEDVSAQQRITNINHIESKNEWVPVTGKPSVIWVNGVDILLRTTTVNDHGHSLYCWFLMLDRLFSSLCPLQQAVRLTIQSIDGKTLYNGSWRVSAWKTLSEYK